MPLARLSEPTQAGLRAVLPSFAATANPIDTTAALLTNNRLFSEILPVLARDPAADAFMIGLPVAGAAYDVPMFARDTQAFAELTGKPLVVAAPQQNVAAPFKAAGLPVYMFETQAIAALNGFLQHSALIARVRDRPLHPVVPLAQPADGHPLNEAQSLHRLAEAGIPVIAHRLCRTPAEAVQALAALGGRVVLKGCSADVMHKSEHGLVRLDLTDAVAVQTAFAECEHTLREAGLRFDGVLVAPMQRGRREMLIGAHRDPIFGPVVLLGDGGKYVEVLQDTTLLIPPFTEGDVLSALEGLRIAPLLRGVRGERPMDVSTFAAAAVAVGALMLDEPDIVSLDINPLLIGDDTQPTIALDAVVVSCGRTM
jgi:acyl-CoA synthetase (NDP forming)